jgi:hypothetical protein
MKVFLTGDSHVGALKRGHDLLALRDQLPADPSVVVRAFGNAVAMRTQFFVEHDDHVEVTDPIYRRRVPVLPIQGFEKSNTIYCIAGPLNLSTVWAPHLWRRYWVTGMPAGRGRPFTAGMLRHVLLTRLQYQLRLIYKLRELDERVCVVESPGPFRHNRMMAQTPPESVIAIYRLCRRIASDELTRRGVASIDIPGECWDDDGFMQARFRNENAEDNYHANAEFGAVMVLECLKSAGTLIDSTATHTPT